MGAWCEAVTSYSKNKEITGAKQRRQVHHGEHNANKISFFVTGEVYLIDIDLLMGTILLNMTDIQFAHDNINYALYPQIPIRFLLEQSENKRVHFCTNTGINKNTNKS
jgi:hypothetical protein